MEAKVILRLLALLPGFSFGCLFSFHIWEYGLQFLSTDVQLLKFPSVDASVGSFVVGSGPVTPE